MMVEESSRHRRDLGWILVAVLVIRVAIMAWGHVLITPPYQYLPPLAIWQRWDGTAYLEIAEHGYSSETLNEERRIFNSRFPPLYPIVVRVASAILPFSPAHAAMIISVVLLMAASCILDLLVQFE